VRRVAVQCKGEGEVTYNEGGLAGRGRLIGQQVSEWVNPSRCCGQSWRYFDIQRMIPLVKTWLKPGGKLVLTYLSWLPRKDRIAQASEQLILRYNPHWSDADFPGSRTIQHAWSTRDVRLVTYHAYEEGIPFSRDSWRGRMRACRGIGAALPADEVARFDQEHDVLL